MAHEFAQKIVNKINPKSFKFGAAVGLVLVLVAFVLNFLWPLMAIYMFLFMFVGYEKDSGLKEVLSLGLGQMSVIILIAAILALITNNWTAIINSVSAFAIALAAILVIEIISKFREKKELAQTSG